MALSETGINIKLNAVTVDQYAVTRDGQRFLFMQPRLELETAAAITVVVNWTAAPQRQSDFALRRDLRRSLGGRAAPRIACL